MKKLVKNILTLSLTFAMIGIYGNLSADNSGETKKKSKKNVVESGIQKEFGKRKKVSNCIDDFNKESKNLLVKDNVLKKRNNKKGEFKGYDVADKVKDYSIIFKSIEKVNDTVYHVLSTFGDTNTVYTMKSTFDVLVDSERNNKLRKCEMLTGKSVVTRPDTPKEIEAKLAKQLKADQESALKELEAYKKNSADIVNLSEDYKNAETAIKAAETSEEVKTIKENALASMKEKVNAAIAVADNAKKLISEEEATTFVNDYANYLSSFVKNVNNKEEVLSMFANEEVEVGVSTLSSGKKTETVANYLNKLAEILNDTYKNNIELNINVENVELFGNKAVVKVVQNFDGNGVYCDVTIKSIELVKENEKTTINKIEVLETKSCK